MRYATLIMMTVVAWVGLSRAYPAGIAPEGGWLVGPAATGRPAVTVAAERPDDPAYNDYRDGYRLILEERWADARKKFDQLLRKYKKSEYRDDAAYWTAYALKHVDARKAAQAYQEFFRKYPGSNYVDDAVADYAELQTLAPVAPQTPERIEIQVDIPPLPGMPPDIHSNIRVMTYNVRKLERKLRREM